MNRFRRPSLSDSMPKNSAPMTSPIRYQVAMSATAPADMLSVVFWVRSAPTLLAIVISRPSRIQATPSAITRWVWNRDQGSLSIRAGIRLRILGLLAVSGVTVIAPSPSCADHGPRCPQLIAGLPSRGIKNQSDLTNLRLGQGRRYPAECEWPRRTRQWAARRNAGVNARSGRETGATGAGARSGSRAQQRKRSNGEGKRDSGSKYGGGAAAQPDADGGTACLACIARTGAPRGAAPPHSVTIQALPIHVQVVIWKTERLFLPNRAVNTFGSRRFQARKLRNQWGPTGFEAGAGPA